MAEISKNQIIDGLLYVTSNQHKFEPMFLVVIGLMMGKFPGKHVTIVEKIK